MSAGHQARKHYCCRHGKQPRDKRGRTAAPLLIRLPGVLRNRAYLAQQAQDPTIITLTLLVANSFVAFFTDRALQGSQATAATAAEEARRARSDVEATQALLEAALAEQRASAQEKAAAEALLRTEQAKGGSLE